MVVAKVVVPVTIREDVAVMLPTNRLLIVPVIASNTEVKKLVEVALSKKVLVA